MGCEAGLRLELFALDMEASIAFYTRVLGFELARHEPGDYASLRLRGVVLGIGPVAKLPEKGGYFGREVATLRRGLGVEIVIEVDDVEGCQERVAASGHPILEPLQEGRPWGLRDFRISDPDGYYLRVTSRPPGD
jgi:lactoylglutathione lyase